MNYLAHLKGLIQMFSIWLGGPLQPRAPFFTSLQILFLYPAARELVVTIAHVDLVYDKTQQLIFNYSIDYSFSIIYNISLAAVRTEDDRDVRNSNQSRMCGGRVGNGLKY